MSPLDPIIEFFCEARTLVQIEADQPCGIWGRTDLPKWVVQISGNSIRTVNGMHYFFLVGIENSWRNDARIEGRVTVAPILSNPALICLRIRHPFRENVASYKRGTSQEGHAC